MSINIKQADGLKRLSQTIEFYKSSSSISIPQLFTGSYNDLTDKPIVDGNATIESIETTQSAFYVQDGSGNTIALIDNQGVHSIDFYANGESVKQHMSSSADQLNDLSGSLDTHKANSTIHITAEEREKWNDPLSDEGDTLYINDAFGNTIAIFDANGLTTTNVTIKLNGEALDISSKIEEIDNRLLSVQNTNNNQDSRLDGLETATEKLDFIDASELDTTLSIVDAHGNPIAQFDASGLTTTEVTIADAEGAPIQVGAKIKGIEDKVLTAEGEIDTLQDQLQTLENNFSSHTDNTTVHITASERETWNTVTSKANQTDLNTTNQNLATEVTNRQNADQALQDNIDTEAQTRANEDAAINERTAEIESSENGVLSITDPSGNAIAQFDENGLLVTEIQTAGNVTVGGNFNSKELAADKVFSRGDIEAQGEVKGATITATGDVSAADVKTSAITSLNSTISTIQNNASALEGRVSTAEGEIDTLQGQVSTLIASDSGKSVRTIANEELAAALIPSDAQESLNTLQEIADWIQDHPEDAAAMNSQIEANTTAINNHINDAEPRFNALEEKTANIEDSAESDAFTIYDKNNQPGFQVDASGTTVHTLNAKTITSENINGTQVSVNEVLTDFLTVGNINSVEQAMNNLAQSITDLENDLRPYSHTHSNKTLLDTYDQTNENIKDAVTKKHEHSNKAILDETTASFTTKYETKLGGLPTGEELTAALNNKQDTLTPGDYIDITNNIVSVKDLPYSALKEVPDTIVHDANYIHTDNNFTAAYKNQLDDISTTYATKDELTTHQNNAEATYRKINDSYSKAKIGELFDERIPTDFYTTSQADNKFAEKPATGYVYATYINTNQWADDLSTTAPIAVAAASGVGPNGNATTLSDLVLKNDIVNNLETNSPNVPLSAAQGQILKGLIDNIGDIAAGSGNGDMLKSVYDTNNDGKVDHAEYSDTANIADNANKFGGKEASEYALVSNLSSYRTVVDSYSKTEVDNLTKNQTPSIATTTTAGGFIAAAENTYAASEINSVTSTSGRFYPVAINKATNQAYVNVPWTNVNSDYVSKNGLGYYNAGDIFTAGYTYYALGNGQDISKYLVCGPNVNGDERGSFFYVSPEDDDIYISEASDGISLDYELAVKKDVANPESDDAILQVQDGLNNTIAYFDKDGLTVTQINAKSDADCFVYNYKVDSYGFYRLDNQGETVDKIQGLDLFINEENEWQALYNLFTDIIPNQNYNGSVVGYFTTASAAFDIPDNLNEYFSTFVNDEPECFKVELIGAYHPGGIMNITLYLTNGTYYSVQINNLAGVYFSNGWKYSNLKTINGESLYGDGDIKIENSSNSGSGDSSTIIIDDALSGTSTNPVQNKIITGALNKKAESSALNNYLKLTGGTITGELTTASLFVHTNIGLNEYIDFGQGVATISLNDSKLSLRASEMSFGKETSYHIDTNDTGIKFYCPEDIDQYPIAQFYRNAFFTNQINSMDQDAVLSLYGGTGVEITSYMGNTILSENGDGAITLGGDVCESIDLKTSADSVKINNESIITSPDSSCLKIVRMTQTAYDALSEVDENTFYIIAPKTITTTSSESKWYNASTSSTGIPSNTTYIIAFSNKFTLGDDQQITGIDDRAYMEWEISYYDENDKLWTIRNDNTYGYSPTLKWQDATYSVGGSQNFLVSNGVPKGYSFYLMLDFSGGASQPHFQNITSVRLSVPLWVKTTTTTVEE